ncbi:MAG TPA: glycerophosphodiester phosphodiesterase, partial [Gammaproteobacteria bacterium]|nr:glycerophosphodiester phosphodiesterase [Gammaproteobacteria bacterium]
SGDGKIVIHHDRKLNPDLTRIKAGTWLTPPTKPLDHYTFEALQQFDMGHARPESSILKRFPRQTAQDGQTIPDLAMLRDRVAPALDDGLLLNLEIKSDPLKPAQGPTPTDWATTLVDELNTLGLMNQCWVQSFDWRVLRQIHALTDKLPTGFLTSAQPDFDTITAHANSASPWLDGYDPEQFSHSLPQAIAAAGGHYWGPCFQDLTRSRVAEAQSLGLEVHTWTVNEITHIETMVDYAVDGIISDYPDRVRTVLAKRQYVLPTVFGD